MKTSCKSPVGTFSYPKLFEAEQILGEGEPKFSLTLLIDKNDPGLQELRACASAAAAKKWPNQKPANIRDPFLDGDETGKPENAGKVMIRLTAKQDRAPRVFGPDKSIITDPRQIYAGCQGRCIVNAFGWSFANKCGVSFGLGDVQKTADGEPIDGSLRGDDVFESVVEDSLF